MKVRSLERKIFSVLLITALVLSVLTVLVPQIEIAYATELFSDGFESNDFSEWTSTTGDPVIVEDPVYSGTYSMESAGGAQSYATKSGFSESEVYIRLYYRTPASLTDAKNKNFLQMSCDTAGYSLRFGINNNGGTWRWRLRWHDGGSFQNPVYSSQQTPVASTWYCVEVHFVKGASDAEYHVYVNGVELSDIAKTGCANDNNMISIQVGDTYVDNNEYSVINVDCVVVADAYIGPESEEELLFTDGFEDNTFDAWNSTTGSPTIVGSPVHCGSYAMETTGIGQSYATKSGFSEDETRVTFAYRTPATLTDTKFSSLIFLLSDTPGDIMRVKITNDSGTLKWGFRYYHNTGLSSIDYWSTQQTPLPSTWYNVTVSYKQNATNAEFKMYIGDDELTDISKTEAICDYAMNTVKIGNPYSTEYSVINIDCVSVYDALYNPPEYIEFESFGTNTTVAGLNCQFHAYATALSGNLSAYIIGTNNTGTMVNQTAVAFPSDVQEAWANITLELNSTGKQTIQWEVFANNTDGDWDASGIQSFVTFTQSTISPLHVDGTRFKNSTEDTYYLAGVHWADLVDDEEFYYGPGLEDWVVNVTMRTEVAKEIGANHIRYSIQLESWINPYIYNGTHVYDEYVDKLDEAIQALIDYDMYGYIVFHYGSSAHNDFMEALLQNTAWNYSVKNYLGEEQGYYYSANARDDWLDWCIEIAAYYKDVPNVMGFQIWAEPAWGRFQAERTSENYDVLFKDWWEFNNDTINSLQAGNPDAISWVVNCGHYFTSYMSPNHWDGRHGASYGTLPQDNVVYSIQKYESEDYRGDASQQAYSDAYENWYDGLGDLDTARELQEDWYVEFCFNFSTVEDVPVFNTEMAYCDDMEYNYKDSVNWNWSREQAQGFYDIWKNYSQGWTQHRWQIGEEYGSGSCWGFFASMDDPDVGDYELAPSGDLMMQTLYNVEYMNLGYPYVFSTPHLTNVTYADNTLNMTINMTSTAYSNYSLTKVYCGSKGEPTSVTGDESYSYSAETTMLSINASHASATDLSVSWEGGGSTYYYLTIESATGGSCNVTVGKHDYLDGTTVYVEAEADSGYSVANWTLDGGDGGSDNPTSVLMTANHTLAPNFVVNQTEAYTYSIDFTNQKVYVQLVYNGTSNPAPSEPCSFAGGSDTTNSTGWAEFDLTALSDFSYNTTAYPTSYPNNNITVPVAKATLTIQALNVSNTISGLSYSNGKFYWSASGTGSTIFKIYSTSTAQYLTINGETDYFKEHWSQTGNVITVSDNLGSTHNSILAFSTSSSPIETGYSSVLFQYLFEGDLLGFVLACYTQTMGSLFYALCIFFVSAVIYIRQKSLFIVSLIWLFIGGTYIVLFWEFSFVAVFFTILGVAGIIVEFILAWRRGH